MPIYLDPRVIEGSLYTLDNNVKQHAITTLINGMEVAVLEHCLQDTVKEMKNLSVAFNTFKKDMEHSTDATPSSSSGRWTNV
jgi:CheY-specific phosphatase CheX